MLQCAATDPALTGAHAAAAGQFGGAPVRLAGEGGVGHVFAAADQGVGSGQRFELGIQAERMVQGIGKALPARPSWPQLARSLLIANSGVPGDRAFHQRQFAATESGAFAGGIVIGKAAGLPGIDCQRLTIERVAQGLAQLGIGDQTKAASQALALQLDDLAVLLQTHPFEAIAAQRRQHMAAGAVLRVEQA